jgi:multiple sugar transport system substrate-binding protein
MKKFFVFLTVALAVALPVFANGTSEGENVNTDMKGVVSEPTTWGPNTFGENVKYDPDLEINNGEPIIIDYWVWTADDLFQSIVDAYSEIHPNVTVNIINNPFSDYWTKLPLMLKGKNGPALFNIHNSYQQNFINYAAPYAINLDDLKADFDGIDNHVIDGKIYYIDYGWMTSSVFYNKALWKKAGLTDADIPETWDEFRDVAKKLTIWNGDKLVQAGLNTNGTLATDVIMGLGYQKGYPLFEKDQTTFNVNNPGIKEALQMAKDWYDVDKVGSKDFGENGFDSLGQGLSAMTLGWGWRGRYIEYFFPDIEYGVFQTPTWDGNPIGYNRLNGECTFGINKNASSAAQAVAQDIVRFYLASDEQQEYSSVYMNTYPTKKSIQNSEKILSIPACKVLAMNADKYVYPGAMPACVEDNAHICAQNIFYNGMSIDEALQVEEDQTNRDLEGTGFVAVENQYAYADKFIY